MADPNVQQPEADEQGAWRRPISARAGEMATAVALLAIGLFFVWRASLLPFGGVALPGPGFFPLVLGGALSVLAVALLYNAKREDPNPVVFLGHRDVLVVLAALACTAYAFERVDTYLTLGIFMAVLLLMVARAPLWKAIVGAMLAMVAVYFIFQVALGVRLPTGEFWEVLRQPPTQNGAQ